MKKLLLEGRFQIEQRTKLRNGFFQSKKPFWNWELAFNRGSILLQVCFVKAANFKKSSSLWYSNNSNSRSVFFPMVIFVQKHIFNSTFTIFACDNALPKKAFRKVPKPRMISLLKWSLFEAHMKPLWSLCEAYVKPVWSLCEVYVKPMYSLCEACRLKHRDGRKNAGCRMFWSQHGRVV